METLSSYNTFYYIVDSERAGHQALTKILFYFKVVAMQHFFILLGAVLLIGSIDVTSSLRLWRLSRANGNFAINLYNKLVDGEDGKNVFFSPFR